MDAQTIAKLASRLPPGIRFKSWLEAEPILRANAIKLGDPVPLPCGLREATAIANEQDRRIAALDAAAMSAAPTTLPVLPATDAARQLIAGHRAIKDPVARLLDYRARAAEIDAAYKIVNAPKPPYDADEVSAAQKIIDDHRAIRDAADRTIHYRQNAAAIDRACRIVSADQKFQESKKSYGR